MSDVSYEVRIALENLMLARRFVWWTPSMRHTAPWVTALALAQHTLEATAIGGHLPLMDATHS